VAGASSEHASTDELDARPSWFDRLWFVWPLGFGAAYGVGHVALNGWGGLVPNAAYHRPMVVVVAASLLAAALGWHRRGRWAATLALACIAAVAMAWQLWPLVGGFWEDESAGKGRLAIYAVAAFIITAAAAPIGGRGRGAGSAIISGAIATAATGAAIVMSNYATLPPALFAAAGWLAVVGVLAWIGRARSTHGLMALGAMACGLAIAQGHLYVEDGLPLLDAVLLAGAWPAMWAASLLPTFGAPRWTRSLARIIIALALTGTAVAFAAMRLAAELEAQSNTPGWG